MICISEPVYQQVKDGVHARFLDEVVVKGKKQSIKIYELIAPKGEVDSTQEKWIRTYESGYAAYAAREWSRAIDLFEECLEQVPADKASKMMVSRCQALLETPPTASWEPIYKLSHK